MRTRDLAVRIYLFIACWCLFVVFSIFSSAPQQDLAWVSLLAITPQLTLGFKLFFLLPFSKVLSINSPSQMLPRIVHSGLWPSRTGIPVDTRSAPLTPARFLGIQLSTGPFWKLTCHGGGSLSWRELLRFVTTIALSYTDPTLLRALQVSSP